MLLEIADAISVVLEHSDAYAQQHERDRLVEIGEMATGMAHEIRNPLGSIKGAVQCLEPSKVPEEYRDFLTVILKKSTGSTALSRNSSTMRAPSKAIPSQPISTRL